VPGEGEGGCLFDEILNLVEPAERSAMDGRSVDLSALGLNMMAMSILEAAKDSARNGKTVLLSCVRSPLRCIAWACACGMSRAAKAQGRA